MKTPGPAERISSGGGGEGANANALKSSEMARNGSKTAKSEVNFQFS